MKGVPPLSKELNSRIPYDRGSRAKSAQRRICFAGHSASSGIIIRMTTKRKECKAKNRPGFVPHTSSFKEVLEERLTDDHGLGWQGANSLQELEAQGDPPSAFFLDKGGAFFRTKVDVIPNLKPKLNPKHKQEVLRLKPMRPRSRSFSLRDRGDWCKEKEGNTDSRKASLGSSERLNQRPVAPADTTRSLAIISSLTRIQRQLLS
ncbi:reverse transcriptase (RNA-dependent DNApolymerase) [Striga asiatica]|uniref:Reverse transcriptase (RNA-dependent DNApolymerase) n=1 Tax=Striga asiatica TaxID=4170 RepID=A0A5A7QU68_STRAF|nr:reverse transcriptase (RNA-dependent DNApolymerase) [Striga asiatica]